MQSRKSGVFRGEYFFAIFQNIKNLCLEKKLTNFYLKNYILKPLKTALYCKDTCMCSIVDMIALHSRSLSLPVSHNPHIGADCESVQALSLGNNSFSLSLS